jgi:hypothetical protein
LTQRPSAITTFFGRSSSPSSFFFQNQATR